MIFIGFKYLYIESKAGGIFSLPNHRELIDKYAAEGWRYIDAIPSLVNGHGQPKTFDLIFEKSNEE